MQTNQSEPPSIGEKWPGTEAIYAGFSMSKDHDKVVHLLLWPDELKDANFEEAMEFASQVNPDMDSHAPTRHQAQTLFNNLSAQFDINQGYWTMEKTKSGDAAFVQFLDDGIQINYQLDVEWSVRGVSEIPIRELSSDHIKTGLYALSNKGFSMENSEKTPQPFGYFRADSMGWTDCAETDEGAQALYDQATVDLLIKQRTALLNALKAVRIVANNSQGIAGWYLNGAIASWDELLPEVSQAIALVTGADHSPDAGKMIADSGKRGAA